MKPRFISLQTRPNLIKTDSNKTPGIRFLFPRGLLQICCGGLKADFNQSKADKEQILISLQKITKCIYVWYWNIQEADSQVVRKKTGLLHTTVRKAEHKSWPKVTHSRPRADPKQTYNFEKQTPPPYPRQTQSRLRVIYLICLGVSWYLIRTVTLTNTRLYITINVLYGIFECNQYCTDTNKYAIIFFKSYLSANPENKCL